MMDRLQKKCFIAASAFHGLLILILLFGSALMPSPPEETFHPISVYDASKISDLLTSGGGPQQVATPTPPAQPETKPAPPAQPAPAPKPEPVVQRRVEQPAEQPKEKPADDPPVTHWLPWNKPKPADTRETKDTSSDKPDPKPQKHRVILDSSDVKTTSHNSREKNTSTDDSAAQAAARRSAARAFSSALHNISKNMSSSTLVDMPGDGSFTEASVNYNDIIASKYYNAWIDPADLDDSAMPIVLARVTISRSGDVISARVIEPSGNRSMDRSIENVLEAVRFIEPFPDSFREQQRTVTIRFNLKTKKALG